MRFASAISGRFANLRGQEGLRRVDRAPVQPRHQAEREHVLRALRLARRHAFDRPRFPVPADLAQQHRASTAGCRGGWSAPRNTSTTATSTASTTSTPTCRRRSRPSPASTTARAGSAPPAPLRQSRRLRHANQQRPGQPGHGGIVLKNQDIGRNWNLGVLGSQADVPRSGRPQRLQLRRSAEHGRSGFNRRRLVERATAHASDPNNPGLAILERVAGPPLLPRRVATRSSTSASARPRCRRSGKRAPTATPATCLPAT